MGTRALTTLGLILATHVSLVTPRMTHAAPPRVEVIDFAAQDVRVAIELERVGRANPALHVQPRPRLDELGLSRAYLAACLTDRTCPGGVAPAKRFHSDPYIVAWLARVPADDPERFDLVVATSPQVMTELAWASPDRDLDGLVAAVQGPEMSGEVARAIVGKKLSPATGRWVMRELIARWSPLVAQFSGEAMMKLDSATTTRRICDDLALPDQTWNGDGTHVPRILELIAARGTTPGEACARTLRAMAASPELSPGWAAKKAALVHFPVETFDAIASAVDHALDVPADSPDNTARWNRRYAFELLFTVGPRTHDPKVADWVLAHIDDARLSPGERQTVLASWLRGLGGHAPKCNAVIDHFCASLPDQCWKGRSPWPTCPPRR